MEAFDSLVIILVLFTNLEVPRQRRTFGVSPPLNKRVVIVKIGWLGRRMRLPCVVVVGTNFQGFD